jgi:hypothetical protein
VPADKLDAALLYGRLGWRIFPCHSIIPGPACSCGRVACKSPSKHPRTRRGLLDATDDEATIRRWWTQWPDANIALATGSGIAVFDIDGAEGEAEFKALVAIHGAVPSTLAAQTGHGHHLVFATRPGAGEVRSSARGNVHVRGEGGYIIVAPSDHISGRKYQWINKVTPASLPDWLRQWSQGYEISRNNVGRDAVQHAVRSAPQSFEALGPLPAHLQIHQSLQPDVTSRASEALRGSWTPAEQARLISALSAIPVKACGYDEFLKIGFALHSLGWDRPDGTSIAFEIWDSWCAQSEHHNTAGLEAKWKGFDRSARGGVSIASIYHLARMAGWGGGAPSPLVADSGEVRAPPGDPTNPPAGPSHLNGHANGVKALPAFFSTAPSQIFFPDLNDKSQPRATMLNAKVAIGALGLDCRYDLFHNRMLVAGELISKWNSAELSDHVAVMIRDIIRYKFGFDPNKANVQDACEALCLARRFDPVLDYLDGLQWDGRPRLDRWMADYLGAADTPLNRAIARLSLIAAVRRARCPGTKFDQIIVLEGPQGQGKSEAIEILAGPDNFSDQSILGVNDRKQQELTEGVWLYEIGELNGIRRADIEHIKAFASRKTDRARPAYGHYMISQPRRTVFFASCNRDDYLQDDTGNRRFWPVAVTRLALTALRRDRDQLWAEAAAQEAGNASHVLPEALWAAAGEEQNKRMAGDTWLELIHRYLNLPERIKHDVNVTDVLCDNQFIGMKPDAVKQSDAIKAGRVLSALRFERYQKRLDDGTRVWRYRRQDPG